jgi:hypothetical protein
MHYFFWAFGVWRSGSQRQGGVWQATKNGVAKGRGARNIKFEKPGETTWNG